MRGLTATMLSWVGFRVKRVGLLCEINYSTPLRVWTGPGNISWDSKTWQGIGALGGMSAVDEKPGIRTSHVDLTLNGVPSELIATALTDTAAGVEVTLWLAGFSVSMGTWTVLEDPEEIVWGLTDVHEIHEGDRFSTIKVIVETPAARLTTKNVLRYTSADQERLFPGDRGLEYAPNVANEILHWPAPEPARGNGNVSGRGSSWDGIPDDTNSNNGNLWFGQ